MMIFLTLSLALVLALYILYLFVPQWDWWLLRAKSYAKKNGPVCCLTFDDGPSKEWTPQVLDILREYGIRSTFFITGERARANPDIVKRVADEGHEIGNHTNSHRIISFRRGKIVKDEISECGNTLQEITGRTPSLIRTPHGFKRPGIKKMLKEMNLTLVPWTKGLWDTDMPPAAELLRRLNKKFDPLEILLLHDGIDNRPITQNRTSTIEALPKIIEEYRKRGYTFKIISDLRSEI